MVVPETDQLIEGAFESEKIRMSAEVGVSWWH